MSDLYIWTIILVLGVGTYFIRFSFLGLLGGKDLPAWVHRHLRYTAVAVLPGLVAPLVLWPSATGGQVDPARLAAALGDLWCWGHDAQCCRGHTLRWGHFVWLYLLARRVLNRIKVVIGRHE